MVTPDIPFPMAANTHPKAATPNNLHNSHTTQLQAEQQSTLAFRLIILNPNTVLVHPTLNPRIPINKAAPQETIARLKACSLEI